MKLPILTCAEKQEA